MKLIASARRAHFAQGDIISGCLQASTRESVHRRSRINKVARSSTHECSPARSLSFWIARPAVSFFILFSANGRGENRVLLVLLLVLVLLPFEDRHGKRCGHRSQFAAQPSPSASLLHAQPSSSMAFLDDGPDLLFGIVPKAEVLRRRLTEVEPGILKQPGAIDDHLVLNVLDQR